MSPIRRATGKTFSSLRIRNYRLFFIGQLISVSGTWMQWVAQSWLVLKLTHSGLALGLVTALQFLPTFVGGMWGGVIADRFDKRRILLVTQTLAAVLAVVLGAVTAAHVVQLWMVYVLAFATGCVTLMDVPARQAFVTEMVGPAEIPNAVALNGAVFNAGRLVGPATAALLIATWGLAPAFFFNGVSYLAVIAGLALMNTSELQRTARAPRGRGQVREGLRFVWRDPELRHTMILIAIVTTFGMNFTVVLPLLSKFTFGGGAGIYGLLTSIMAAGALVGALIAAAAGRSSMRPMLFTAFGFAIAALGAAVAPNIPVEAIVLVPVGAMSIAFIAIANSALQLRAPARMRGRVMALYSLVFLGGNAIGSPIAGGISQVFGARWGLGMAGLTSLAVSIAIAMVHRPLRTARVETAQVAAAIAVAEPDAVRSA